MKDTIFKLLDEHFEIDMLMDPDPVKKENERHYGDPYLYIIFSWSDGNSLRIVIRNWKTHLTFSKTSIIPDIEITKKYLVSFIKETVYNYGGDSKNILIDWYEIKKVEIRDIKLKSLGL
jgi:hypothetical protein